MEEKLYIKKDFIGQEDFELGRGHVTQDRPTATTLHKVDRTVNLGLINDAILNRTIYSLGKDIDVIYFTGFYKPFDGGEGTYRRQEFTIDEDLGMVLNSKHFSYLREGVIATVDIEWFGAKGDGSDDTQAFLHAFKHKSIRLGNHKHYCITLAKPIEVDLAYGFELLGNGSTLEIDNVVGSIPLIFKPTKAILHFLLDKLTIKSSSSTKALELQSQELVTFINDNAKYIPTSIDPELPEYVDIESKQTITGSWAYQRLPRSDKMPTQDRHPINKKFVDNLTPLGADTNNYVELDGLNEIPAKKTIKELHCIGGDSHNPETNAMTLNYILSEMLFYSGGLAKINAYIDSLPTKAVTVTPEVGALYLQPPTNGISAPKGPNELYEGTTWEKVDIRMVDETGGEMKFVRGAPGYRYTPGASNWRMAIAYATVWERIA